MLKKILARIGLKPMGKMTLSAVVIHADGSKEDLGVIAKGKVELTPEVSN